MSRGPGCIERAIERTLREQSSRSFTVEELAGAAYPSADLIEKKHRVAVLRALSKVEKRMDLWFFDAHEPPWHLIVTITGNARSYAHGYFRTFRQERPLAEIEAMMNVPEVIAAMEPGGRLWCGAEFALLHIELDRTGLRKLYGPDWHTHPSGRPGNMDMPWAMRLEELTPEAQSLWMLRELLHSYTYSPKHTYSPCRPDDVPVHEFDFIHLAEKQLGFGCWSTDGPTAATPSCHAS
jgi:hypothetical protein